MLLYCLNILNPDNIHLNRGNHEEEQVNIKFGLITQINKQFPMSDIFTPINQIMIHQSSAILIQNPLNNKYIYLAHGGLPTDNSKKLAPIIDKINFKYKYLIVPNEIGENIRWNDFESIQKTLDGQRGVGSSIVIGYDIITTAQNKDIELIIRGHQDHPSNTKLLPLFDPTRPAYTPTPACTIC
jgi:hypothetical protein